MAFYDFLVSKALKNQYGYLAKLKHNPYSNWTYQQQHTNKSLKNQK
ncbi:hypothetical protein MPG70_06370 [Helicobacter pylori]|nr:hypothetical protein [Helicobacter pylori]UOS26486.1 hypothetical protein MPF95_06695 [Helicobacter pylori]UOS65759.1 hypothetical protein MPG70_06370 [Helicobacter pylori]